MGQRAAIAHADIIITNDIIKRIGAVMVVIMMMI